MSIEISRTQTLFQKDNESIQFSGYVLKTTGESNASLSRSIAEQRQRDLMVGTVCTVLVQNNPGFNFSISYHDLYTFISFALSSLIVILSIGLLFL